MDEEADAGALELYVVRHADAGDPAGWAGEDADRPLSEEGRRQAERLGRLLAELPLRPDALITSPKLRAAETARLVGQAVDVVASPDPRLAGGLEADGLGELIAALDGSVRQVMLVGHDPDLSDLVSWLVGAPISLRKGALARTDLPDRRVGAGMGSLRWLVPPDAVPG
jgi:phosphohistidine phosphatase